MRALPGREGVTRPFGYLDIFLLFLCPVAGVVMPSGPWPSGLLDLLARWSVWSLRRVWARLAGSVCLVSGAAWACLPPP